MVDQLDLVDKTLEQKIEEAIDVDASVERPDGDEMELSESVKNSMRVRNVADTIADHIGEKFVKYPFVDETKMSYGSGDTGRQSKLFITPTEDTTKDELRQTGQQLKSILEEIFPTDFYVGISHNMTVDEEGYPMETDTFNLFLVYQVRSHGSPQKPPGQSTEVL